jgi:hypothetical protein
MMDPDNAALQAKLDKAVKALEIAEADSPYRFGRLAMTIRRIRAFKELTND